ncbi:hypothetical protein SEA_PETERSON_65 [Mycobacterium phage Peterson]|nr:hypothetical protein SEA_PETERSON_65 [Mycobacterium phage Peterson]
MNPELRAVLTEALAAHEVLSLDASPEGYVIECACGWYYTREDHAKHQAEIIVSLPGVAVIQLPEPTSTRYEGDEHEPMDRLSWQVNGEFEASVWNVGEVQISEFLDVWEVREPISPDVAEHFGIALIAAAKGARK